ncbi:hypothetical protein EXIGLDRAFT_193910 [Exidia glandulosa HHB12029]|uniref:Uncharacterized protein n=1 Tax=Exidia glandulosa HHB12029 TaxID=1314781 RepID=A0A165EW86_EXIGL|nr:hypothetical protein EXIGLDRAFT_193910 [Exidia glandulosa HHB12029]
MFHLDAQTAILAIVLTRRLFCPNTSRYHRVNQPPGSRAWARRYHRYLDWVVAAAFLGLMLQSETSARTSRHYWLRNRRRLWKHASMLCTLFVASSFRMDSL